MMSGIGLPALLCPGLICVGLATMAPLAAATPAAADFRICNLTKGRVGIALGYKDGEGWATEGWWNVVAGNCETLLRGNLAARFYYVYAVDYDRGGEWSGQAFMCTRDKELPSGAPETVSPAVTTGPAFSKSTPASSKPGQYN